ncbi:hypothetical protein F4804DRAFT_152560 [Jackrogersella minutella]|nr:hypothetical protein F4804DRAFT_152560 [Jackrogersella minutella]
MLKRYRFCAFLVGKWRTRIFLFSSFLRGFQVWRLHMIPHLCFGYVVIRSSPKTRQRQCCNAIAWDCVLQPRRDRRQCFCAIVWELVSWALLTHVSSSFFGALGVGQEK